MSRFLVEFFVARERYHPYSRAYLCTPIGRNSKVSRYDLIPGELNERAAARFIYPFPALSVKLKHQALM